MSYHINYINEQNNDLNERDQFNDGQIDNEQYFLFKGQGVTPQGDENDVNMNNSILNNINNNSAFDHSLNIINYNGVFEHSINNIDNFMDNEYSAAPVPLKRMEADISFNNNLLNNNIIDKIDNIEKNDNNINNIENIDNDINNNLNASKNIFQDEIKNIEENINNDDKYLNKPFAHNDFSCFNPNFIDNEKDISNCLLIEDDNNIISLNNQKDEEKNNNINNIYVEKITSFPGMKESNNFINQLNPENSQNINIMDAPTNNILSNSSSQNTNASSLSVSYNNSLNKNNSLISSKIKNSNGLENIVNTFDPGKNRKENFTTKTKMKNKTEKKDEKTKKKKYIRRFKPDSLRKKIKARLHKKLRDILNNNLKECGSKMLFDYLPQPFITNVNVIENKAYLKLTMRTLFKMVFGNKSKDKEKVKTNSKVLNYLDSHDEIRVKSGVDDFLNSTYEDVIRKYILGNLFEEDVKKLYMEGESKEYIEKYNFIGKHWIEFYNNNGKILIV